MPDKPSNLELHLGEVELNLRTPGAELGSALELIRYNNQILIPNIIDYIFQGGLYGLFICFY